MHDTRHLLGEGRVVGDDHHGGAALAVDAKEELVNGVARGAVEVARGLVGEHDLGALGEGAGEGDALLLAARELARAVVQAVAEADLFEQGGGLGLDLAQRLALNDAGHGHVLDRGELGQEVVKLEDEPDGLVAQRGEARAAERGGGLAVEKDGTAGGQVEGADAVQERRLAGARGADDGDELALVDVERDAPQDLERAPIVVVRLVDVFDFDERRGHS